MTTSLPLAQNAELTRLGIGYPLSSESHDRGHSSHSTSSNVGVANNRHSPISELNNDEHESPRSTESPQSLPTSAPSHQTGFGLDTSDQLTTSSDTSLALLRTPPPPVPTWQTSNIVKQRDFNIPPPPFPYTAPPPQYRDVQNQSTYPRSAPYYFPPQGMHPMVKSERDIEQQRQMAEEENHRRQRELVKARRHVCPVCDKRFNRPSSLNTHMSVHTGAKPYQCTREGCGRRFSVSSNLRRHERTHEARARPPKQQQPQRTSSAAAATHYSPQPTMFVQAPAPPPAISYPYSYHSSMPVQRYPPYQMTRNDYHSSLLHREYHTGTGGSTGSGGGSGNTTPGQQTILMPQPTKSNTLMLG